GPRPFVEEEGEVADDRLTVRPGLVLEVDPQTPVEVERPGHVTGDEPDHVHLGWLGHAANLSKRPPRHGLAQIEAMIAARCKEYISRGECGSWRRNACAGRRSARPVQDDQSTKPIDRYKPRAGSLSASTRRATDVAPAATRRLRPCSSTRRATERPRISGSTNSSMMKGPGGVSGHGAWRTVSRTPTILPSD